MRFALFLTILLTWTASAHAGTVAIVRLPRPTPPLTEALSRLHGELLSVGLEVRKIERPANRGMSRADSRGWLEELASASGIDAVIEVVGDVTPDAVDVWVIEKSPRRLEVSRVTLESDASNASERLAIRAVEVLRSTFLENDMIASERHSDPSVEPAASNLPKTKPYTPRDRLERFGVEMGAAALTSLDGVGPAILPTVRLTWTARPWFVVQATGAGIGSRPTVATTTGSARIAQQYGVLGGSYRFCPDRRLDPFIALAAGALRTAVEGRADSPRQGNSLDQWSFILDASLGAQVRLSGRYFSSLAAHVQMAETYVAIYFMDAVIATTGRPNLALSLTIGAWL